MLALNGVQKSFSVREGRQNILHDITCTVHDKEIIAILGPNGAGKTTLLKIIAGIDRPDSGTVRWQSHHPLRVGFIPQDTRNGLFPWQTVGQHIQFALNTIRDSTPLYSCNNILQLLGLSSHQTKYPYELSGGLAQLLAIGRALACTPNMLMLDEPFAALDYHTRIAMHERLLALHATLRIPMIIVTHSLDEAIFLADRLLILTPSPASIAQEIKITLPRPRTFAMRGNTEYARTHREALTIVQGFLPRL